MTSVSPSAAATTDPFTTIPEIDLAHWRSAADDGERRAFAEQVCRICHEVGFFQLVGHGIEPDFLDEHARQRARFFALPEADRLSIDKRNSPHFRGFEPVGSELTGGRPDLREQLDLSTEHPVRGLDLEPPYLRLDGPNQWIDEGLLPGFRAHMSEFFAAMQQLADELLELFSVGLGLAVSHLREMFGSYPHSLVKLIHYPPTPSDGAGVNPHHDAGFLTLLLQHEVSGLQVLNPADEWIDVAPTPGAFVVNIGEMLQEMTGNYFVATTHRVITGAERFSSAWFHGPDLTTRLDPLPLDPSFAAAVAASPHHAGAGFMARKNEIEAGVDGIGSGQGAGVYGQQLWNYYCRSYPDNVAAHHPDHAPA
ncbi:MAG: 2-oxoglutarate and iron-dependent oxygenase domain-containing protein [Acidimicrobiales bacterium]